LAFHKENKIFSLPDLFLNASLTKNDVRVLEVNQVRLALLAYQGTSFHHLFTVLLIPMKMRTRSSLFEPLYLFLLLFNEIPKQVGSVLTACHCKVFFLFELFQLISESLILPL